MSGTIAAGLVKTFSTLIALVCIVVIVPYVRFTAYDQPEDPGAFRGQKWYNPYADVADTLLRANFHAHSKSWAGLTWGENSASELIEAYASRGYQIPALSNYHKITPAAKYHTPLIHIPAYEHGFNHEKIHCLCIGAKKVSYFDYPWHFSTDLTRHIIFNMRDHCELVALAHPGARNAHVPRDMPSFDGLQLMEVANTQGARTQYWDAILSAGRAVWFLANDDTHALNDGEAFMRWNMIYVDTPTSEAAIESLKRGNHYGILSYNGKWEDNRLTEFAVYGDTLRISLQDTFNRVDFIGQDGASRHVVVGGTTASYQLQDTDTYVRAEIHQDNCVMYLNPVIRYDGITVPHERIMVKTILTFKTWLGRVVSLLMIGLILFGWIKLIRR